MKKVCKCFLSTHGEDLVTSLIVIVLSTAALLAGKYFEIPEFVSQATLVIPMVVMVWATKLKKDVNGGSE